MEKTDVPLPGLGSPPGDPLQNDKGGSRQPPILIPLFKAGRAFQRAPPPIQFETAVGRLRVPWNSDPPLLSPRIADLARRGILSNSLESGSIIRASDLAPAVDVLTGKISLDDNYEWRTRPVSSDTDGSLEPREDIQCLFFVSVNSDELPSYRFWIDDEDEDPLMHKGNVAKDVDIQDGSRPTPTAQSEYFLQIQADKSSSVQTNLESSENKERRPARFEIPDVIARIQGRQARSSIISPNFETPTFDKEALLRKESTSTSIATKAIFSTSEQSQGLPPHDSHSKSPAKPLLSPGEKSIAKDNVVLIHCQKGALCLRDFGHQSLIELGRFMIAYEEIEGGTTKSDTALTADPTALYIDVMRPDGTSEETKVASGTAGSRNYSNFVKRFMGQAGYLFRVRSGALESSTPFEVFQTSDLKMVRPEVGYYYASAGWNGDEPADHEMNSASFEHGLSFLFKSVTPEDPTPDQLVVQIPSHGSYLINPNSGKMPFLRPTIQAVFGIVTDDAIENSETQGPASVSVEELVGDTEPDDDTDRSKSPEQRKEDEDIPADDRMEKTSNRSDLNVEHERQESSQGSSGDERSNNQQQDLDRPKFTCPYNGCSAVLDLDSDISTSEVIFRHVQDHVVQQARALVKICEYPGCFADLQHLGNLQRQEHLRGHQSAIESQRECEESKVTCNLLQEENVRMHTQISKRKVDQQIQTDLEKEFHPAQEMVSHANDERTQLPANRHQTKQTDFLEAPASALSAGSVPKKLTYCNVCLQSVNKLSQTANENHAVRCGTTTDAFSAFTVAEAKAVRDQQRAAKTQASAVPMTEAGAEKSKDPDIPPARATRAQSKLRVPDDEVREDPDLDSATTSASGKRKRGPAGGSIASKKTKQR